MSSKALIFGVLGLAYTLLSLIDKNEYLISIAKKLDIILPDYAKSITLLIFEKHTLTTAILILLIFLAVTIISLLILIKIPPSPAIKITNKVSIKKIKTLEKVNILSYFGSITDIKNKKNVQVIVTSENSNLELASISSTSMSGRVREMATTKDIDGNITSDPLNEEIIKYKENKRTTSFALGTCVSSTSTELEKYGVEKVIHAVSINKNNDNTIDYSDSAIEKIISYSIRNCIEKSFDSLFIPIFGIGSAQQLPEELIDKQLKSLKLVLDNEINNITKPLNIYLGVYRELDYLHLRRSMAKIFG